MHKILALLCVSLVLSIASGATCDSGKALRKMFNMTGLNATKTYTDLNYCASLKNGAVCCPDTQINDLQAMTDEVLDNLTKLVSSRDLYFSQLGDPQEALEQALVTFLQTTISYTEALSGYVTEANTAAAEASEDDGGFSLSDLNAYGGDDGSDAGAGADADENMNFASDFSDLGDALGDDSEMGANLFALLGSDNEYSGIYDSFDSGNFDTMTGMMGSLDSDDINALQDQFNNYTAEDFGAMSEFFAAFGTAGQKFFNQILYTLSILASGDTQGFEDAVGNLTVAEADAYDNNANHAHDVEGQYDHAVNSSVTYTNFSQVGNFTQFQTALMAYLNSTEQTLQQFMLMASMMMGGGMGDMDNYGDYSDMGDYGNFSMSDMGDYSNYTTGDMGDMGDMGDYSNYTMSDDGDYTGMDGDYTGMDGMDGMDGMGSIMSLYAMQAMNEAFSALANFSTFLNHSNVNMTKLAQSLQILAGANVTAAELAELFSTFEQIAADPESLQSLLGLFVNEAVGTVTGANAMEDDPLYASDTDGYSLADTFANISQIVEEMGDTFDNIKVSLSDYQGYRTQCIVELVKIQGAAWCLACDPNATDHGFDSLSKTLTMSDDVCGRLTNACFDYISNAGFQNAAINATRLIATIEAAQAALTSNNGAAFFKAGYNYTGDFLPANLPDNCTSADNCDWICKGLFSNGNVNLDNLVAGGVMQSATTNAGGRMLAEESFIPRMLANSTKSSSSSKSSSSKNATAANTNAKKSNKTFNPADDEAGTSVTFKNDPGNVKSAMMTYGSVMTATVMVMFSMMF